MDPPPAALTVFTAATSPAPPAAQGTFTDAAAAAPAEPTSGTAAAQAAKNPRRSARPDAEAFGLLSPELGPKAGKRKKAGARAG